MLARAHSPAAFRCLDFLGSLSRGTRLLFPGNVGCKWALSIWSKSDEQRRVRENSRTVYQVICNPRQKSWDTKKFSPPPNFILIIRWFFPFLLEKRDIFQRWLGGWGIRDTAQVSQLLLAGIVVLRWSDGEGLVNEWYLWQMERSPPKRKFPEFPI